MILICIGTRPEYLKIKPLINVLDGEIPYRVLFTGQHTDLLRDIDYESIEINDGDNRLDSIVCSVLNNDNIFDGISHVMVQGDTTSSFAVALAAFHRKLPVIHIEAGLRTYDMDHPYPEEFNRQAISRIASVHFCPTKESAKNLFRENTSGKIFVTGNTILDNLVGVVPRYDDVVLVTMHRRENHAKMQEWFGVIDELANQHKDLKFVLPIHPNPNVKKYSDMFHYVNVVNPLEYEELIDILAQSKIVITDSGGIQEESSFLGKKAIVCRNRTERIEGMDYFHFLADSPKTLFDIFNVHIHNYKVDRDDCPYGDGMASLKIVNHLKEIIDNDILF
jgi:UDP-N-acetylglucosamine 2-epimerase (non-hydrolysing)